MFRQRHGDSSARTPGGSRDRVAETPRQTPGAVRHGDNRSHRATATLLRPACEASRATQRCMPPDPKPKVDYLNPLRRTEVPDFAKRIASRGRRWCERWPRYPEKRAAGQIIVMAGADRGSRRGSSIAHVQDDCHARCARARVRARHRDQR